MIGRIEAQNEILHFKLNEKGVNIPKFEVEKRKTKIHQMPSEDEISQALNRAKVHAINDAKEFGMSLDEIVLENYALPYKINNYISTETTFYSDEENELSNEIERKLEYPIFGYGMNALQEISDVEEIIDAESDDKKFVEIILDNGTIKKIRKSSLVWILSDKGSKISNDRLKRVRVTTRNTSYKRARRASTN